MHKGMCATLVSLMASAISLKQTQTLIQGQIPGHEDPEVRSEVGASPIYPQSTREKETYRQKLNEQICSWFSCGHIAVVPKLPYVPVTGRASENRPLGQAPEVSESLDLSWSSGSYLSIHISTDG